MGARHESGEGLHPLCHTAQLGAEPAVPVPWCSLPLTPGGEPVLRAVYAVLLGLLGPQQSPISCAPLAYKRIFRKKGNLTLTGCC